MTENTKPHLITIDLNQFKLHIALKNRVELTLHFNSPSRKFYLSMIAFVVNEMKKQGKITSIPLEGHHDLLALLNETIGGSAGSSETEPLLSRIYRKWQHALPNLEEAPLFMVLGRKKGYEEGGKAYPFTESEKDSWANLFEYKGSHENVRLKFAIDRIGASLNDIAIIYEDSLNADAWEKFISSLKEKKAEPDRLVPEEPEVAVPPRERRRRLSPIGSRWLVLIAAIVVVLGTIALTLWKNNSGPNRGDVASVKRMAFPLPDEPSIAVLPFVNMSGDQKQEFLCDALTENITTMLSMISELFVISRNSAFEYKGKPIDVKKVAENLGVRYVLEGSIQKSGEHIRVTAQLIDAMSGHHISSEKYDRDMTNFFPVLDDITRNIGIALQIKLTEGEQARVFHKDTKNLEAWALASQAFDVIQRFTKEDVARAKELSEQAVKLDPQYGFAWSLLAWTYFDGAIAGWCESPEEYFKKAVELNHKALTLNKDLFCATAMIGSIYLWQRQYEEAIAMGRRSIELGPNIALNYAALAITLNCAGNFEEAIALGERAIRLHPFCPLWYLDTLATSYRMAGRYEDALALYRQILPRAQKEPFYLFPAHIGLAEVYSEMGRVEEAHAQAKEVLRIAPSFSLENWCKTQPFRDPKHLEKRLAALRKAGLK
ncbi:MAG TPA: tetratricopeptide repeat protein [Thermodesulfobacteriota bacterium]|nr:tetratricopeptide repeat protein [Thermodesulfobacteriota bacterium]